MSSEPVFDIISRSVVKITIKQSDREKDNIYRCGTIMECGPNHIYVITDGNELPKNIGNCTAIIVELPDETIVSPAEKYCHIDNGILGIICFPEKIQQTFDTNLVKGIELCHQALQMSERVYVHEGFRGRLSPGNVTSLHGDYFSHNCGVVWLAEYGAPVVNRRGEFVGMSSSLECHLRAKVVSALTDTIERIKDVLFNVI